MRSSGVEADMILSVWPPLSQMFMMSGISGDFVMSQNKELFYFNLIHFDSIKFLSSSGSGSGSGSKSKVKVKSLKSKLDPEVGSVMG